MFDGSDEYILRGILENTDHMRDIFNVLYKIKLELELSNALKMHEVGLIDDEEFNKRARSYNKECGFE